MAEYERNPQKVRGFFQALGGTRTPEMLLMVWRIIQGMEIKDIQLSYQRQQAFEVRVVLQSPYGEEDAPYARRTFTTLPCCADGIHEISGRPSLTDSTH